MSSNDRQENNSSFEDDLESDSARDFLPPPSQVRTDKQRSSNHRTDDKDNTPLQHNLRVSPVLGKTNRARDEALARQAARDQLLLVPSSAHTSRASRVSRTLTNSRISSTAPIQRSEQPLHQSRYNSSPLHNVGGADDTIANELYSVPMGSFTEDDSPPRGQENRFPPAPPESRRPQSGARAPHSAPDVMYQYPPGYYQPYYHLPHMQPARTSRRGNPRLNHPHTLGYPSYLPVYGYPPPRPPPPQRFEPPPPPIPPVAPASQVPSSPTFEAEPTDSGWDFDDMFPSTASSESNEGNAETPTKSNQRVFRSPPSDRLKDLSSSPMFRTSPNLSFGIETTPGGVEAEDFSPMGPAFAGLGSGKLNLSGEDDDDEPLSLQQTSASFIGLMQYFEAEDSGLMDVRRSPVLSSSERRARSKTESKPSIVQPLKDEGSVPSIKSLPVAAPDDGRRDRHEPMPHAVSAVKPRNIWLDHSNSGGAMKRFTVGRAQDSTSMSLEGINKMLRKPNHDTQTVPPFEPTHTPLPDFSMRKTAQHPSSQAGELKLPAKSHQRTQPQKQREGLTSQRPSHAPMPHQLSSHQNPYVLHGQSHQMSYHPPSYDQRQSKPSTDFTQHISGSSPMPFGNSASKFPPGQPHPRGISPQTAGRNFYHHGTTPQVPISVLPPASLPNAVHPHSFTGAHTPQMAHAHLRRPVSEPSKAYTGHRNRQALPYGNQAHSASKVPARVTSPSEPDSEPVGTHQTPGIKSPGSPVGKENLDSIRSPVLSASKRVPCHCKKSRCLKLYCECFSMKMFCSGCKCVDCYNTVQHVSIRDKAIAEAMTKNKAAFESRSTGTLTTCKCRRSECLKKYCECFTSGEVCHAKCKCIGCANHAGSQKLIDKRRKMKDVKGAEYAMRISKEAWESSTLTASAKPSRLEARAPTPSPALRQTVYRIPTSIPPVYYPSEPLLTHAAEFSPMDRSERPYVTPTYAMTPSSRASITKQAPGSRKEPPTPVAPLSFKVEANESANKAIPEAKVEVVSTVATHQTPKPVTTVAPTPSASARGVRRLFTDPSVTQSLSKKPKLTESAAVARSNLLTLFFGSKLPPQSRVSVLTILSYLSNADLYQASLVCKDWSDLAVDDALWKRTS